MLAYYVKEKGWTTDDYTKACKWHKMGYTVVTYSSKSRYNWRTNVIEEF